MLLTLTMVLSVLLTWLCIRWSRRLMPVALPNERSAHQRPTPSGGGIAFVVATACGVAVAAFAGLSLSTTDLVLLVPALCVGLLGGLDDFFELSAATRFTGQTIIAVAFAFVIGGFPVLEMPGLTLDTGPVGIALTAVLFIYLTNIYNFMDGIDGIAASEGVFVFGAASLVLWSEGVNAIGLAIVAAGLVGFLLLNRPPARIFMGDIGSYFIGGLVAAAAVKFSLDGATTLWFWLILAGVFLADASVTLLTRLYCGENIFLAHNLHAYQHAARRIGVGRTLLGVSALNLVWLAPMALLAQFSPHFGVAWTIIAYIPLVGLVIYFDAGRRKTTNASV